MDEICQPGNTNASTAQGSTKTVALLTMPGLEQNSHMRNQNRRGSSLQACESEPEISGDSEGGPESVARTQQAPPSKTKRKPSRRKRARLVPPHSRTSRFRGVYWEPKGSKWYSSISFNHKQIHLGSFNTQEEAARAFDQEAIKLRGVNTFTNFPSAVYSLGSNPTEAKIIHSVPSKPNNEHSCTGKSLKGQDDVIAQAILKEKDDSAATALLSLGSALQANPGSSAGHLNCVLAPPTALLGQKRKRPGGLAPKLRPRLDGTGRARSKFTGVYQQSRGNGWFASICVDKSMRYLGTFATEEEAARAFDQEGMRLRGTGIELNLPHEAEAFLKKLKKEEALAAKNGRPPTRRPGPRPQVSAGPDFEDGTLGRADAGWQDSLPALPNSPPHSRASGLRAKRRRCPPPRKFQDFLVLDGETQQSSESDRSSKEGHISGGLPAWRVRRLRTSEPQLQHVRKQTGEAASYGEGQFSQIVRPTAVVASARLCTEASRDLKSSAMHLPDVGAGDPYQSLLAPAMSSLPIALSPLPVRVGSQTSYDQVPKDQTRRPAAPAMPNHLRAPTSPAPAVPPAGSSSIPFGSRTTTMSFLLPHSIPNTATPQGPYHLRPLLPSQHAVSGFQTTAMQPPTSYAIYIRNPPPPLQEPWPFTAQRNPRDTTYPEAGRAHPGHSVDATPRQGGAKADQGYQPHVPPSPSQQQRQQAISLLKQQCGLSHSQAFARPTGQNPAQQHGLLGQTYATPHVCQPPPQHNLPKSHGQQNPELSLTSHMPETALQRLSDVPNQESIAAPKKQTGQLPQPSASTIGGNTKDLVTPPGGAQTFQELLNSKLEVDAALAGRTQASDLQLSQPESHPSKPKAESEGPEHWCGAEHAMPTDQSQAQSLQTTWLQNIRAAGRAGSTGMSLKQLPSQAHMAHKDMPQPLGSSCAELPMLWQGAPAESLQEAAFDKGAGCTEGLKHGLIVPDHQWSSDADAVAELPIEEGHRPTSSNCPILIR